MLEESSSLEPVTYEFASSLSFSLSLQPLGMALKSILARLFGEVHRPAMASSLQWSLCACLSSMHFSSVVLLSALTVTRSLPKGMWAFKAHPFYALCNRNAKLGIRRWNHQILIQRNVGLDLSLVCTGQQENKAGTKVMKSPDPYSKEYAIGNLSWD